MIQGLQDLLKQRNLIKTAPLDALKGTRLGIDLGVWVHETLAEQPEPLTVAVGGLPLALAARISEHISTLQRLFILPVFVLQGFAPLRSYPHFSANDRRSADRSRAWDQYEAGEVEAASETFAQSDPLLQYDLARPLSKTLRVLNTTSLTAPFLASAQLAYMERHQKGYVHSMYGNEMLLMFDGVERVITSIDLEKKTFTFVSKAAVLSELKCSADEFLDACILSGFEHCPTFPALLDGTAQLRNPKTLGAQGVPPPSTSPPGQKNVVNPLTVVQLVKQYRGGQQAIMASAGSNGPRSTQYLDAFCRARALIKYSLVLAEDGKVLPLSLAISEAQNKGRPSSNPPVIRLGNGVLKPGPSEIPGDLHEVFFYRLPDEIYTHLSRGLIGAQVYQSLLSGQCVELEPLEGGSLPELQTFLRKTLLETPLSPRCVSLALAANQLGEFWKNRRVTAIYWFNPGHSHELAWTSDQTQASLTRVSRWNVPSSIIAHALTEMPYSRIDLELCLGQTRTPEGAQATITPRAPSEPPLERKDEIVVNARWRLLELRGFINHEHLHTALGRALYHAIKDTQINDALQEPLYVALELVRAHALHATYFNKGKATFGGGPILHTIEGVSNNAEEENAHLLLVMRALSLVPMTLLPKPLGEKTPLSRELLAFHAFSRAMTRSLRGLAETIASHMLLSGAATAKEPDVLLLIGHGLPFQQEPNTMLGIIVKCYVEGLLTFLGKYAADADKDELSEARSMIVGMLQDNFGEIRDVRHELIRGFRFWNALMVAVRLLGQEGELEPTYVAQFEAADKWLQPMMFQ